MSDSAKFDPPEFSEGPEEGIAIVGMACRFPGSAGPEEFWTHLSAGVEGIARLSDEELLAAGVDPALLAHPNYVKAAPRLAGYDRFDAGFFGYNAMEAQVMDPQQRVLLECAWTALEHAGYDPARCDGTIGVYAGSKTNTYLFHLASNPEVLQAWDTLQLILGGDQAMLASRISYKFNLKGPSYGVQSACSTALVAVHLACQGLLLDECRMALAGGVAINVPHDEGYLYQEGGILSADGHCRPFDAAAGGTVFGSGVGVVVLKRLSDALDDGDRIWAVIRGSAINNDGSEKANFTAPSVEGQTDVILEALACAGVDAESISYLEAHGTGTSLGDPIEALALTDAYRAGTEKKGFCAIGSVKGNVGHLDAAAGMAGLIKTVLALEHQAIPPTLHFQASNPKIDFENSPFRVQAELTDWKPGPQPRRAGLSSLGFGGTNAHLILQEPPPRKPSETSRSCQLLVLSARTPTALEKATANLARHLDAHPELDPADVAHTLQVGRRPFDHRRIAVCHDLEEAVEILDTVDGERVVTGQFQEGQQRFVFLFPGQGAQYAGMGQGLYETEATFRREVDRCCELLEPQLGTDLREVIPLGSGTHGRRRRTAPTAAVLEQTAITQPALFVVEYALAQLWASWGIRPQAMIGHSIGEYVAACLAGVFSLEDALALVATRGRLMQEMPGGAMLSVAAPEATLTPLLGEELSLAAVNAPKRCVASGPEEAVAVLAEALAERGVKTRRLHTSHAFHSPMMEPIIERFTEAVGRVTVQPPQIPFFSNLTGRRITDEEATDPTYWARHLRQAVRFADGLGEMLREPGALLLEVGPGTSLSTLARQHPARSGQLVASSLRHPGDQRSDSAFLLTTLGKLWIAGTDVDWTSFYARERRQRVPLPTYPFESKRYWIESPRAAGRVRPQLTLEKKADVGEWLYRSTWQPSPLTETPETKTKTKTKTKTAPWLVFSDAGRLGPGLVERLRQDGREVISVEAGESFATLSDDGYRIRPESPGDYEELFEALAANGAVPATIVHLWSVTGRRDELPAAELYELCQPLGFQSLLNLAQALGKRNLSEPVEIAVVSDGMQPVDGAAEVTAEKATLLGPCKVIPKEYPHLTCRSIDLAAGDEAPSEQLDQILAELTARPAERVVAYRGGDRWVEGFEPLTLDDETAGPGLRVEGVYLITGGLGGVGFVLAEALASELRARLVLTGRVELPERSAWEEWLASHDDDDAVAGKIRKVARLEELGAEVLVARADAADRERMAEVVAEARERFGTLHGAIHVAGIAGGGLIQVKTPEMAAAVVDPKVRGAMVLDDVLGDKPFDFLVVYSSLQTVLADFGQADYTGANAFLDAFAQRRTARGRLTLAIDWDNWREVGIAVDTEVPAHLREWREELLDKAIAPQEGVELFRRLAGHRHSRVVVSTQDLPERIELSREFTGRTILEALGSADAAGLAGGDGAVVSTTASFSSAAELEQRIAEIWRRVLDVDAVGIHDNFFDLGGDSLTGMQLVSELRRELGVELSPVTLYEAPTVSALVRLVRPDAGAAPAVSAAPAAAAETAERDAVAIVGMACRFPGADGVDAFWHNLRQGVESISFWSVEELEAAGIDPALLDDPSYVRARPVMAAAEDFDAGLFGYSPREAQLMDPQHRVFLECAWEALEDAGYDPERYSGSIGAFGGASINTYLFNLYSNPEALDSTDPMQTIIGNEKDSLTTSVSYKLNLKGPGVTVQTFCSTSLVAAHLARNSLLAGECDLALVGAVSVAVPQASGYHFQEDGILSPDGHCRPFDAEARGTVFGNGVGIVVLKRLRDAVAAADTIHAVIRGSAINNDGSLKVGYTAPSVEGQAEVIAAALADAGVGADSIDYLEAHGTGTVLGDPIEVTALTRAYRAHTEDRGYCALGSVKGNVGHLDRAAGVASLIKAVLALDHREIPPAVNFTAPNPKIDFASSPFFVNAELREWQAREGPRRAGVSALGFGGTNAHLILEEAPAAEAVSESRPWQLLLLSARTATALEAATARLADTLDADPEVPLADVAHTLQVGRRELGHRRAVACRTGEAGEAAAALRALDPGRVFSAIHEPGHRPVVFLFPGQGAQYAGMGRELYETEATFRREVDRCCELLEPQLGVDLREVIPLGSAAHGRTRRSAPTATVLEQTAITQPALFVVEYALAQLWMEWGVRPEAMVGHSIGEYVAACLAGVFSLEDALAVVAERGRLIQELPGGEMLSLALAEEELEARFPEGLPGDVALAAVNAPGRLVVSGPAEAIAHLAERPELDGVETRRLHTSHAFHSEMLEPAVEPFTRVVAGVTRNAPRLPFISCVSGGWIEASEATDPAYWARQLRRPVRFSAGAEEILRQGSRVLIEIGPGTTLSNLVRRHPQARERTVVAAMRHPRDERSETAVALESLGKLWLAGVAIDWPGFYRHERRRRIPLPGYPFERQRYWIDAAEPAAAAGGLAAGRRPEQWLFGPSWKRSRLPRPGTPRQPGDGGPWLLFADPSGLADVMAERLRAQGAAVTVVQPGESFARTGEGSYALRPGEDRDYDALCGELAELPAVVFHFWSMSAPIVDPADPAYFAACQALGPYSLLRLARSLERRRPEEPIRIWAVSDGLVEVTGEEPCAPEQAPLVAACRAVSEQYRNLVCRHLDLFIRPRTNGRAGRLIELALAEFRADASELTVAYRGNHRWVPVVEALGLAENASDDRSVEPAGGTFLLTAALEEPGFSVAGALSYLGMSRGGETRLVAIEPRELPPREAWDEWLREDQTPSGEQLAVFLGELADGISLPVEITAEGRDIPALARSAEDELGLETLPEDFDQAVDALCAAYIYRLFAGQVDTAPGTSYPRDELRRKMGVVTHFERFFDYLLQALADDGLVELSAEIVTFRAAAADVADPEQLRESLERRYPSFKPGLECLDHCAGHYQEAFSGATDPVRILYPGGSFEMLKAVMDTQVRYSSTRIYQQVMTELIRDLAERTPERTLRILEVGAGDGNLTWDLVASLDGLNVEYHFTDIGRSFVLNAQKRAAERGLDCMRFGVLDVSQNPAEQGFERYGFDVVVALDVVHATERIRESLMNLQRLLVPGGVMLLLEAARDQRWVTMIWGLAEGWWLFSDLDLRPSSPLLDPEGWESVLEGLGFSSSAAFPQQPEVRATADHALLVARQPAELRSPDYLEWATGRWQERRRRTAERIRKARELESMGAEVMLVAADLADSEQVSAAVRRGEQRLGPISGVVHSSGPEAGDESDPRAWATHFASGAGAVRSLETALAGRSPDFALLVSSLAAAAGQPGSAAAAGMDSFFTARAASYNHRSIDRARTTAPTPVPVSVRIQLRPEKNHRDDTLAWRSVVWGLQGQGSEPGRPSDSPRRGAAVLAHLLAHDELPRVIVARRPPPGMAEAWNRVPEVREAAEAAVGAEGAELVGEHVAPRTDDELTVAGIWQEVLGVEGVGVHDHFFDLGGDSLVATQLNTRLYNSFGLRIPVEKLFEQPTIEGQARTIARVRAEREEQRQSKVLAMLAEMSDEDAEALLRERTV